MLLLVVPILFLGAYLYPYLPAHDLSWCAIKIGTGIDCPGCGMVRAISALVHGDIWQSIRYHPLGIVVAGWLVYRWALSLRGAVATKQSPEGKLKVKSQKLKVSLSYLFVLALFAVWIVRMIV